MFAAADEFADDDDGDACPVDENESNTGSRCGGVPMPRWCCDLACAYNHKVAFKAQHAPIIHRICAYTITPGVLGLLKICLLRRNAPLFKFRELRRKPQNERTAMSTQDTTNMVELRHFFVTPGVAAAHALSGMAIFVGAESVLKTTPLYLLGLIVQSPINGAFVLIVASVLAVIAYCMREPRRSWFMLLILPQQCLLLMHFVSAACLL
jgi:hypothetical protein